MLFFGLGLANMIQEGWIQEWVPRQAVQEGGGFALRPEFVVKIGGLGFSGIKVRIPLWAH